MIFRPDLHTLQMNPMTQQAQYPLDQFMNILPALLRGRTAPVEQVRNQPVQIIYLWAITERSCSNSSDQFRLSSMNESAC